MKDDMPATHRVRYISDEKSIFFKKGEIYEARKPRGRGRESFWVFYFSEEEMDEAGYYARPAGQFEVVEEI